VIGIISGIL